MANAAITASKIQSTLVERPERCGAACACAVALAKVTALTVKLSRNAVEIGVLSLASADAGAGAGQEPGEGATVGGISDANGLELSGICGPSDQFSNTATIRV